MPPYGFEGLPKRPGALSCADEKKLRLESIQSAKNTLTLMIHTYAESQKELWRKVPWLALQADGRTGYLDHWSIAYSNGLWCISPSGRDYTEFVDCATGKLVDGQLRELTEGRLLPLASRLDVLDAETVIEHLLKEAQKERPSYYSADQWGRAEQLRQKKIKEHKLTEVYERTRAPVWSFSID